MFIECPAGGIAGRQTVLMFWRPKSVKNVTATALGGLRQKLVGYRGTGELVGPGETARLGFRVGVDMLGMVPEGSTDGEKVVLPGQYELYVSDGTATEQLARGIRIVA